MGNMPKRSAIRQVEQNPALAYRERCSAPTRAQSNWQTNGTTTRSLQTQDAAWFLGVAVGRRLGGER
jgi:hypothetical protein